MERTEYVFKYFFIFFVNLCGLRGGFLDSSRSINKLTYTSNGVAGVHVTREYLRYGFLLLCNYLLCRVNMTNSALSQPTTSGETWNF